MSYGSEAQYLIGLNLARAALANDAYPFNLLAIRTLTAQQHNVGRHEQVFPLRLAEN